MANNANPHGYYALNAGEWAPALDGRADLDGYRSSAQRLENFIPMVQGPLLRRGGTRYLGEARSLNSKLVPFVRARRLAYMLEFVGSAIHFWYADGTRVLGPDGGELSIPSPWPVPSLTLPDGEFAFDYVQDGDRMFIVNRYGNFLPRILTRTSANTFTLTQFNPNFGPFDAANDTDTTMWVSAATGVVTIRASEAVFTEADVGRLIRIDVESDHTRTWMADNENINDETYIISDGKEYQNMGGSDKSGFVAPTHTSGTVSDSRLRWRYLTARYGVARITSRVSSTQVVATVTRRFPNALLDDFRASPLWRMGAFRTGTFPNAVSFFRERLVFGMGRTLHMSWAGQPDEFSPDDAGDINPECAVSIVLRSGRADDITCLADGDTLFAATEGGEFVVGPQTDSEPFGPNNVRQTPVGSYGAAPIRTPRVGGSLLSVQVAGKKLRAVSYDVSENSQIMRNAMVRAEHLVDTTRIVAVARQDEPYPVTWVRTAAGDLYSFTFDPLQNANGWARQVLGGGGKVLSMAVIPATDGGEEELWLVVNRAGTVSIERLVPGIRGGQGTADARYFDASLSRLFGSPVTQLSGLAHLAGQQVGVLADGQTVLGAEVAPDGTLNLPFPARNVTVGYVAPAIYVGPLKALPGMSQSGNVAASKPGRDTRISLKLHRSLGGKAGPSLDKLDEIPGLNWRAPATSMDTAAPLFSGLVQMPWPGDYETEGRNCIVADGGYPFMLQGIFG